MKLLEFKSYMLKDKFAFLNESEFKSFSKEKEERLLNSIERFAKFDFGIMDFPGHFTYKDFLNVIDIINIENGVIRLPYKSCWFEIGLIDKNSKFSVNDILIQELEIGKFEISHYFFYKDNNLFYKTPFSCIFNIHDDSLKINSPNFLIKRSELKIVMNQFRLIVNIFLISLVQLNLKSTIISQDRQETKHKRGEQKTYSKFNIVKIVEELKLKNPYNGGSHALALAHDRMGHIVCYHRFTEKEFTRWRIDSKVNQNNPAQMLKTYKMMEAAMQPGLSWNQRQRIMEAAKKGTLH